MKKNILKYIIEFLIVTFGVFLGMYVNNLQSKKKVNIEKKRSLNYIFKELEKNELVLENSIEYIKTIKEDFEGISEILLLEEVKDKLFLDNNFFVFQDLQCWRGVGPIVLDNTAFETAKVNGIVKEYDIELLQSISRIYNGQAFYADFQKATMNNLIGDFDYSMKIVEAVFLIKTMYGDNLINQEKLLKGIKEFKEKNDYLINY